jgi:hypothetical protein
MPRRTLFTIAATVALVVGVLGLGIAATTTSHLKNGDNLNVTCPTNGVQSYAKTNTRTGTVSCRKATTAPTSTAPTSPTTTPTTGTWQCTVPIGGSCGAYVYPKIPNSNGYNTYVPNQAINVHGTGTLSANDPGDWQATYNLSDCGGCVQVYAHVQQLFNNWGGSTWNGSQDTPMDSLSTLKIHYDETSPTNAAYEYAPDIWTDGYANDVMFWTDTRGRCNEGAFGGTLLGHATFAGQDWTVHRYGGAGAEIIFVLDGAGGSGTCAQQSVGVVDIKAGLAWLSALPANAPGGDYPDHPVVSIVASGWEIAQASNATFVMNDYSIEAQ